MHNLVILIKICKILYLNWGKRLLFSDFLSEKIENFDELQLPEFIVICWNFAHVFYLTMSKKACSGIFKICLDLLLLIKM